MTRSSDYDYHLPEELIAQAPLERRSDARLLVADRRRQTIEHRYVRDLPALLSAGDLLVVNDTRVVPARLLGRRTATGGRWEGLFLSADAAGRFHLLGKTRGKLTIGETVTLETPAGEDDVELRLVERAEDGVFVFEPQTSDDAWTLLERVGRVPLPPYIRGGEMVESDRQRYQTVYAERPGAVAAPTAGLHFNDELLSQIAERGVRIARLTLHVGVGTFRPLATEDLESHVMHAEWGELTEECAAMVNETRRAGNRVVAVGTTSVRVLETAADDGRVRPWRGETRLFIRPPYEFQVVDALLTNFHLPRSTLLVLVRCFGGDALIRRAYEEAIERKYRFYSYGDAMFIV